MFCMKCGCQIPEGAAFCPGCGQPVGTAIRQPGQPYVQSQQPYAQPQQTYAQPRQQYAQPQQTYAQPQQAPQPAAKKSGTGVGVKVAAAALAGLAAFFGGKALVDGLGGDPPTDTRPAYTQRADVTQSPGNTLPGWQSDPGGQSDPGSQSNPGGQSDPGGQIDPGGQSNPGGSYNAFSPDGSFQGFTGVSQQPVAAGPAAGMTTEEAAAQEIFFAFQQFTYASEHDDPNYDSEQFILKLDPETGTALLMGDPEDEEDVLPFQYDPESGTIRLEMEDGGDYAVMELIRNADGSWSGSAHGYEDGEEMHAYVELNRVTPTKDGAWMTLETGEVFTDDERTWLRDTRLGQEFMGRAAEYAAANGYSMQARDPREQTPGYQPGPTLQRPVELSRELIDYYVMVEGQNRIRASLEVQVSHVKLPKTDSITEQEFDALVEEYVKRNGYMGRS